MIKTVRIVQLSDGWLLDGRFFSKVAWQWRKGSPVNYAAFVIGTVNDPNADHPDTWDGLGARRFLRLIESAGLHPSGNTMADARRLRGRRVPVTALRRKKDLR